jgi:hypothetical protein
MIEFPRASLNELSITDIWLMIRNTYLYAATYAYKGPWLFVISTRH